MQPQSNLKLMTFVSDSDLQIYFKKKKNDSMVNFTMKIYFPICLPTTAFQYGDVKELRQPKFRHELKKCSKICVNFNRNWRCCSGWCGRNSVKHFLSIPNYK